VLFRSRDEFEAEPLSAELVMAVLFHDIGKPFTIKTPEADGVDRIRFDQHDTLGAELAKRISIRLKLSSPPSDDPLHVDPEKIWWLIRSHLIGIRSDIENMKNRTMEKYFLLDERLGQLLMMLIFADGTATLSPEGKGTTSNYFKIVERVEELKKIRSEKIFFRPLLNGNEIMTLFDLKPGPHIGRLAGLLREEQLSKRIQTREEAIDFLRQEKEESQKDIIL
jgi:poly(A) polymerase